MKDDTISRKAAVDAMEQAKEQYFDRTVVIGKMQDIINNLPSVKLEPSEDVVPRTSVEFICRKNTVSTNPYEHKYHDKFIQFMDDPEISDFGRWQHSNGFNTALVAVKCDLDKVPSAQPECAKDFVMLKVRDLNGRPYYSIIYLEEGCEHEGYSSYDLKVISEYLKRYFGFAQPEIIRCRECKWWDRCPSSTIAPLYHLCRRVGRMNMTADDFCSRAEQWEVSE